MDLHALVTRADGHFRAKCLELDVYSEGLTPEEATDRLISALQRHIDEICESVLGPLTFTAVGQPDLHCATGRSLGSEAPGAERALASGTSNTGMPAGSRVLTIPGDILTRSCN